MHLLSWIHDFLYTPIHSPMHPIPFRETPFFREIKRQLQRPDLPDEVKSALIATLRETLKEQSKNYE